MKTGQTIAALRESRGITQEMLAESLFVSRELVSKWEQGKRQPSYSMIEKMAEYFCVSAEYLAPQGNSILAELNECLPFDTNKDNLPNLLSAFLYTLPKREQAIFVRRYHFMDDYQSIADFFHISVGGVRSTLSKTRKKLKQYFSEA